MRRSLAFEHWNCTCVDGDYVVVPEGSFPVAVVNQTGLAILQGIAGGLADEEIIAQLATRHGRPHEECRADFQRFLQHVSSLNYLAAEQQ